MSLDDRLREIGSDIFHDGVTQQDINRIKQAFADEGYFKVPPEQLLSPVREGLNYLSGQEWYDRFKDEINKEHPIDMLLADTLRAAKRAAKLTNE